MSQLEDVFHVCLAGRIVSCDWDLIERLRSRYLVSVMEHVEVLLRHSFLNSTHLLVVDCCENAGIVTEILPLLRQRYPDLCVILVDGGLSQKQIASAFQEGVKDYFASPYDVELLVERMDFLCMKLGTKVGNSETA